ncbi:anti-adapter protein iraM [Klebsiella variicola]|nr:anti-adapter protein iraM [Klebsiella variicola]
MFAGKKSAQIREILISESAWEEMTCLFAPSLINDQYHSLKIYNITVYDEAQWEKLRERPSCPYQAGGKQSDSCFFQSFCAIKRCPNNIPRGEPWR